METVKPLRQALTQSPLWRVSLIFNYHKCDILAIVLTMEKEDSAAFIDLDVSSTELKLSSDK